MTGQCDQARPLCERALRIYEKTVGPDHPSVALTLGNLARMLMDRGQYDQARPLFERAIRIQEEALGLDHPQVARNLNDLARLLQATNQLGEAKPLFRRAVAILSRPEFGGGSEHPYLPEVVECYRALLTDMGLPEDEIEHKVQEALGGGE